MAHNLYDLVKQIIWYYDLREKFSITIQDSPLSKDTLKSLENVSEEISSLNFNLYWILLFSIRVKSLSIKCCTYCVSHWDCEILFGLNILASRKYFDNFSIKYWRKWNGIWLKKLRKISIE